MVSVVPPQDLVHGSKYLVDIVYKDAVCNPPQSAGSVEVTFAGNFTLAPILYAPESSKFMSQTFKINFVFIEAGLQNSTKITFIPVVPDSSPPPSVCGFARIDAYSHVLVLEDFSEGIQDFNMPSTSFSNAASASSHITTITPSYDLVDGACYNVELSYQDGASHPAAGVTHTMVRYVGNETLPLSAFLPSSGSRVKEAFSFEYRLTEPAEADSLKLTISAESGGVSDSHGDRVIVFQGDSLFAGPHSITFQKLSTIVLDVNVKSCFISGVNNCIDMVHDAYYTFRLEYKDLAGNAAQNIAETQLRFDTATGAPTFTLPAASSFIPEPFILVYELPEPALENTVQLKIEPETGNVIDDTGSERLIILGPAYEFGPELSGTTRHELKIGPLVNLNGKSSFI